MTIDFDNMQSITDSQMLKAIRLGIAQVTVGGQAYTINGRTFSRANLKDLQDLEQLYATRVAEAASPTGTMTAYASFNRQQ